MPSDASRSLASFSRSQTTASAYRLAVVTNSHRSEASRNCRANWRWAATTESMSGVSSSAMPRGIPSLVASTSSPSRPGLALLPYSRQRRQEDVLREPSDVLGMAGEHGTVRGRPANARGAHLAPGDAVQQRGLARAGRPDHGDEDRRARLPQPREQVVVDLADQSLALSPGRLDPPEVEQQLRPADRVAQFEQRGLELARVDPGMRLAGLPPQL